MQTILKFCLAIFVCSFLSACSATIYEGGRYNSWDRGNWGWEHNGWGGVYWYNDDWGHRHHRHHRHYR